MELGNGVGFLVHNKVECGGTGWIAKDARRAGKVVLLPQKIF
jgi:hypothetical protein